MRRIIPILLSLLLVLSLPLAAFAAIGDTLSLTEGELSITDESTYDDITVTGGELYIHGVRVSLNGAKYGTNTIAVSGGTLRLEDAWLSGNTAATLNITGGLITGSGIYNEKPSRVAAGTVNITGGIVQIPDILGFDILIDGNCAVIVEKIANFGNYTDIPYTYNKGLLIVGNSGTVKGEVTLPGAVTVKSGVTLDFVNGAKITNPQLLTIEEGATILIDGQPSDSDADATAVTLDLSNLPESGGDGWYYYGGNTIVLKEGYEFTVTGEPDDVIMIDNYGTITGGTFHSSCFVVNFGTIQEGTFDCLVDNNGTITGGSFTSVDNSGTITGGNFASLTNEGTITITDGSVAVEWCHGDPELGEITVNGVEHWHSGFETVYRPFDSQLHYVYEYICTDNCPVNYAANVSGYDHTAAPTYAPLADGSQHVVTYSCCGNVTEDHTGGTATCHKQAVCDLCGASYGEKDTTNHDSTVQFDTNGFCPYCGAYEPAVLNSDNVYEIGNAGQLYWFAHQVNHDNANFGSANAILTADIQVNQNVLNPDGTLAADVSDFRVWTPIGFLQNTSSGSVPNVYSGTFDGAGHTISGLYFTGYADYNTSGCAFIGENEGTVKNLGLLDSYFSSQNGAGGIVDGNGGTITDCYNFATVISQNVVGGVAGSNHGTISGCYNAGMILGEYNTGGVVGQIILAGIVENCYNTGIVGGDVGNSYVGGIVGIMWTFESSEIPILRNCWNNGVVTGEVAVGTIAGNVDSGVIENCYYLSDTETDTFDGTTAKTSAQFASGEVTFLLGEAFGQNIDNGGENQGYPVFSDATVFCGYTDCVDVTPGYSNTRLYPLGSGHSAPNADGCCDHCGNLLSASVAIGETTTYYLDIQEAIDAAETGTEELPARLTFLVDMDLWGDTSNLEINTGVITVDLNGHIIMSQTGSILNIGNYNEHSDAVVTITDSSQEQTGTIFANGYAMGIRCFGGHLILKSGNIRVEDDDKLLATGIRVMGGELTITGGYIYAQTNGTRTPAKGVDLVEGSTGTITGGKLVSTIAVNADNDLTVSGDVILSGSQYAIQCQGNLTVNGGIITGTTGDIWHNAASGTFVLGIDQDTGLGATFPGGISISGGTLEGVLAEGAAYWQDGLQLEVDEEATVIAGGDVTVKAVCDHSGNTNTVWAPQGFATHGLSCSICGYYAATEPHNIDHDTGICQVCDYQPPCAVTVDGNTTYCLDRAIVPELLAEATDNSIVEIKLYMDWIGSYISQTLTIDRGIVTLDINGCTMDARIILMDAQLTIVDSAEVKGTILNNGGAMAEIYGGKLIIDASADYFGQTEGHENWLIMKGDDNDKVFTIGSTGTEDIVLPQGAVALDNTVGTVWAETNVLSDEIYHICLHVHADADNDHDCDDCEKVLSECADADKDHKCDLCGAELSKCADADKNHKCDVCDKVLTECVDENKDYKCDICGKDLEKPVIEDVTRLAGANRWETSLKVADEMKANLGLEKFDSIIIASGNDFADALAGSYLSTVKNAPILLGWGKAGKYVTLDEANIAYIKANLAEGGTVYILGGVNAVPELYETELKGYNVKRLGGANRFETNLLILEEAGVAEGSEILVCTSTNFADSLSASATAKPILLVFNEYGKLYGKQPEFLAGLKNCTFTVIGGESAVSADLAKAIEAYGKVERLAGANRFETSVLVAQKYFASPETAVLAYAWNYPDGLCGGSLAYSLKAPLILTMTKYEAKAVEYAKNAGIEIGLVLGGDTLIPDDAVRAIFAMEKADEIVIK